MGALTAVCEGDNQVFGWFRKPHVAAKDPLTAWTISAVSACQPSLSSTEVERVTATLLHSVQTGESIPHSIELSYPLLNVAVAYWDDRASVHQSLLHHFSTLAAQKRDSMLAFSLALVGEWQEIVPPGWSLPSLRYVEVEPWAVSPAKPGYQFAETLEKTYREILNADFEGAKTYPISRFFAQFGPEYTHSAPWQRALIQHWIHSFLITSIIQNQLSSADTWPWHLFRNTFYAGFDRDAAKTLLKVQNSKAREYVQSIIANELRQVQSLRQRFFNNIRIKINAVGLNEVERRVRPFLGGISFESSREEVNKILGAGWHIDEANIALRPVKLMTRVGEWERQKHNYWDMLARDIQLGTRHWAETEPTMG